MAYEILLKRNLSKKRIEHSSRVASVAIELAKCHCVNVEWAFEAGMLHDYCKEYSIDRLVSESIKCNIISDPLELQMPQILHGPVAACVLRQYNIVEQEEVLQAIRFHTVGHPEMDNLAKIIFIADYVEPKRNTPNINELKELAKKNLDSAVLMIINQTLNYLQAREDFIHPNMICLRNKLLFKERK